MAFKMKDAAPSDSKDVLQLIQELAAHEGYSSPLTESYVTQYLAHFGCGILLAERDDQIIGLLSYSFIPNLFHAGNTCLIKELVIKSEYRGKGIGSALIQAIIERAEQHDCKEISISAMPENIPAINLYRSMGFEDEAVFLEKHF